MEHHDYDDPLVLFSHPREIVAFNETLPSTFWCLINSLDAEQQQDSHNKNV